MLDWTGLDGLDWIPEPPDHKSTAWAVLKKGRFEGTVPWLPRMFAKHKIYLGFLRGKLSKKLWENDRTHFKVFFGPKKSSLGSLKVQNFSFKPGSSVQKGHAEPSSWNVSIICETNNSVWGKVIISESNYQNIIWLTFDRGQFCGNTSTLIWCINHD